MWKKVQGLAVAKGAHWRLPATALLGFVLAAGLVFLQLQDAARYIDDREREQQSKIVEAIVDQTLRNFVALTYDYAGRDTLHDVLAHRTQDDAWLEQNLGPSLAEEFGITDVVVLSPDNTVVHAAEAEEEDGGELENEDSTTHPSFVELAAKARAAVAAKGPGVASGFVDISGEIHFAAAATVVPDDHDHRAGKDHTAHVLIMMADVDAHLFDQVADRFHIQKFHFAEARPAGPAIPVRIANGAVAGHFTWDEANFGSDFAAASSPYILAVFTGLGLFTLLTVHEGLRLTNSLKRTLVAQAEAQAASREKDKFLKVMSHELRTPLNAVIGFSEIMSNEMLGPHGVPAYKDYSTQIHQSGTHLLNIFNDILTLIKLESGDFQVDCARLNATEVAKEAIEELIPHSQAAAVDVVLEPADDAYVVADRKALRRVLVAVVGNAIKFSNAKSTVEVKFAARPENLVEIGVRDRGIGMSADQVAVAGLPFHQVEGPLARRNGGTGVGLALTRGFVGLMEGRIQIESAEGEGTLARLLLPAAA